MGDDILTEDDMIAHAIALSLGQTPTPAGRGEGDGGMDRTPDPIGASSPGAIPGPSASGGGGVQPDPPARSNTTQSCDSLLNEGEDSFNGSLNWMKQTSHQEKTESLRSSPDLGIATEADIDPQQSGTLDTPQSGSVGKNETTSGSKTSKTNRDSGSPEVERANPPVDVRYITLDGQGTPEVRTDSRVNPVGAASHHLPYTRLSSLHDMVKSGDQSSSWVPDKEALDLIVAMGISMNAAKRALYNTGNDNAEAAVSWVFDNIGDSELHDPFEPPCVAGAEGRLGGWGPIYLSSDEMVQEGFAFNKDEAYKMTLIVNTELKMGIGKIAAQVGHAVLGLFHFLESQHELRSGLREWENVGARKIVLKGRDADHLMELKRKTDEAHIPSILVQDAGKTQVEPGSLTVLALFGKTKNIDLVSGSLKLL